MTTDRRTEIDAAVAADDFEAWQALKLADYIEDKRRWSHYQEKWIDPDAEAIKRFTDDLPSDWSDAKRYRQQAEETRIKCFRSAVPKRAGEVALTACVDDELIKKVAAWAQASETDGGILVLSGPAGVGKTVAACWFASRLPWAPLFMRAADFATTSRYDKEAREKWLETAVMILDDLGAEYLDPKGSFLVDLDELVDHFYSEKRWLVITTNCDKAQFKARYGTRIVDRLAEAGTWITTAGESRRRKAKP